MNDDSGPMRVAAANILTAVSSAVLAVTVLSLTLRLDRFDLRSPLIYLRDANIFLFRAKSIVEGNWSWFNPRVGMPFGGEFYDFPMNITLDSAFMWLLSRFTSSPPLIVNLEWLIAIGLSAALACYALTRLGFKPVVSAAFGAIFAVLPYTYFRGTRHLHCVDYAIPLVALSAIEVVRSSWTNNGQTTGRPAIAGSLAKVPLYAWIGALLAGVSYIYTAFFAASVLIMSGIVGTLKGRNVRPIVIGMALAGVIAGVTALDISPSLRYWSRNGQNASMLFKSPAEAELYALKIRYLITPVPDHPIPIFREAEARLSTTKYPSFTNENEWGRLGTTGSLGFLCLVLFAIGTSVSQRWSNSAMAGLLGPCAALTLSCLLFAAVGGFGDFFTAFISPDIRCYTRIFPFIGFFSITAAAALLAPVERRVPAPLRPLLWLALVLVANFDQAVPSYAKDHNQTLYKQDEDFVRYVETLLPVNSAVFELPFSDFPNEIPPAQLLINDLLRPYLHSTKYRWSWPAVSGTTPAEWNRLVTSLPPAEMLRAVVHLGFSGLWVDSTGYTRDASPEAAVTAELGQHPVRSPDGRFLFYDLRPYSTALHTTEASMTHAELIARDPVRVVFERGFYYAEQGAGHTWRWSLARGRITLINPLNTPRAVSLSMYLRPADPSWHSVVLRGPHTELALNDAGLQTVPLTLAPLQVISLDLMCGCRAQQPETAPRPLYFYVSDVSLREAP